MARGRKILLVTLILASGGASALVFLKPDAGRWFTAEPPGEKSAEAAPLAAATPEAAPGSPTSPAKASPEPAKQEPAKQEPSKVAALVKPVPPAASPAANVPAKTADKTEKSETEKREVAPVDPAREPSHLHPPDWAKGTFPSRPVFGGARPEEKTGPAGKSAETPVGQPAREPARETPAGESLFDRLGKGSSVLEGSDPSARPPVAGGTTPVDPRASTTETKALPTADNAGPRTAQKAAPAGTYETKTHTVRDGDTLRKLAERYLGDSSRFLEIYDANRQLLRSPEVLPIGARLSIHVKPASPGAVREPIRIPAETASLPAESGGYPTANPSANPGIQPLKPLRPLVPVPPEVFAKPRPR